MLRNVNSKLWLMQGITVNVLLLPEGEDPDSFVHKTSPDTVQQTLTANEQTFLDFMYSALVKDVTNPDLRSVGVKQLLQAVAVIPSPITQESYLQECPRLTGYSVEALMGEMRAI